jgi:tectonin beta-propeller repeat-containing protein 1
MAWQWEGDWQLELTLDGQPLDHQGWMYAVDFPAQYCSKKQWKSCVRRRLWVRSRRYSAMNSWCAIAPLHKDATSVRFIAVRTTFRWSVFFFKEPFIDISIGGQSVAGAEPGTMIVWAVTSHNRVSPPRFIFTFRKSLV